MKIRSRAANTGRAREGPALTPKMTGADVELANFITGAAPRLDRPGATTAHDASVRLLREIDGISPYRAVAPLLRGSIWQRSEPSRLHRGSPGSTGLDGGCDLRDWGRKWLPSNGGCVYIDLSHLEVCQPEVISCYDHLAVWHAMLRIVRKAWERANARMQDGNRIEVLVNNSDGFGNSYGSHLNFLISRSAWEDIFERRMHYLLFLATFQVSSIVLAGQGKVGSENGREAVPYQISARADFFETLVGPQTTHQRPIVNSRDEAHTGGEGRFGESGPARYHCIFYDSTLCHASTLLKVGPLQLILAMIEARCVDPGLILEDPLAALTRYSRDPLLDSRAGTLSGNRYTAVELQLRFLEQARRFSESADLERIVPESGKILSLWEDSLLKLKAKDFSALAPRLDWVLKMLLLDRAVARRRDLDWESPEIKRLDHLYSSIDPRVGLYWTYEASDALERHVGEDHIARFVHAPPEDTRAWTRARLLGRVNGERISSLDWDRFSFVGRDSGGWPQCVTLRMGDPLGFTRLRTEAAFRRERRLGRWVERLSPEAEASAAKGNPESRARESSPRSPAGLSLARAKPDGGRSYSDVGEESSEFGG